MPLREQFIGYQPLRCPPAMPPSQLQPQEEFDHGSQQSSKTEPPAERLLTLGPFKTTRTRSKVYKRAIALWWQEVIAALLVCAAVIASYATVAPYQNEPLPAWPRYITLGALLSTYSVILRLAATFLLAEGLAGLKWRWFNQSDGAPLRDLELHDKATRGPIGSLQLLWRLPWPRTWQWVGCVLMVVALAIGPLTQLVLHYEECPVLVEGAAGKRQHPSCIDVLWPGRASRGRNQYSDSSRAEFD